MFLANGCNGGKCFIFFIRVSSSRQLTCWSESIYPNISKELSDPNIRAKYFVESQAHIKKDFIDTIHEANSLTDSFCCHVSSRPQVYFHI